MTVTETSEAIRMAQIQDAGDSGPRLLVQLLPERGTVASVEAAGTLLVQGSGGLMYCEVLLTGVGSSYEVGDTVLFSPLAREAGGVVFGRIGLYAKDPAPARVRIQAAESLSLECGKASIDLRADGKVMIRGEDVLVRAKGTQRIRAGTVSIN